MNARRADRSREHVSRRVAAGTTSAPLLELTGIVKAFPNVLANDGVDFDLRQGEIHALLGENGSGKSTLMKIVYGIYQPDAGTIRIRGEQAQIADPHAAARYGIGMVHQHFMLVPSLTVIENLMLGFELRRGVLLDRRSMEREVTDLFERVGLPPVPLHVRTSTLTVGEQQRIEIVKALLRAADILILDEPTAVLTPQEVEGLGAVLQQLRGRGYGIVLITHKLNEVVRYSDRVTVLRNGQRVACQSSENMDVRTLANLMVGREIRDISVAGVNSDGASRKELLALDRISVSTPDGRHLLKDVSLSINAGEIVGVAGVSGNGQQPLGDVLAGLLPPNSGQVRIKGDVPDRWGINYAIAGGVGYIPEDRQTMGLVLDFSVAENLMLKCIAMPPFSRHGRLNWAEIYRHADSLVKRFDVRPPLSRQRVRGLSGGNQQKVILAREIVADNIVIIASEPTRGLDIGSVDYIHRQLLEQRGAGRGVVLISTDLDELMKLSDRIAVIYEGRILDILERTQATRERVGMLMAGIREEIAA